MEQFVAWLAELTPLTIYAVVGLTTFLENFFPPTPSDLAVALAGFITQQSGVSPIVVWLVAWLANLAGSIGLYLIARRFGREFLVSPLGRRLLPAEAVLTMEREYLRFGAVGIFVGRFLPGLRAFVAPFVGLVNLPPLRAFLAMAAATGLWYAIIVWAGVRLGAEWQAINRFIGHLNRTLSIVGLAVAALIAYWLWRRRVAAGPRRRRLLRMVGVAIGEAGGPAGETGDIADAGSAALLYELTRGDPGLSLEQRGAIAAVLRERWGIGASDGRASGASSEPVITDTAELVTMVTERYDLRRRIQLAERLYRLAMSDGTLSRHEERLMRRAADLLGLSPMNLTEARQRAVQ